MNSAPALAPWTLLALSAAAAAQTSRQAADGIIDVSFTGGEIAVITALLAAVAGVVGILWQQYLTSQARMLNDAVKARDDSHVEIRTVLEARIAALVQRLQAAEQENAEARTFGRQLAAQQIELLKSVVEQDRIQSAHTEERLNALLNAAHIRAAPPPADTGGRAG